MKSDKLKCEKPLNEMIINVNIETDKFIKVKSHNFIMLWLLLLI